MDNTQRRPCCSTPTRGHDRRPRSCRLRGREHPRLRECEQQIVQPAGFPQSCQQENKQKGGGRKKLDRCRKCFFLARHAYCKKERMTKGYCFVKGQGYILCRKRKISEAARKFMKLQFLIALISFNISNVSTLACNLYFLGSKSF